MKMKMTKKKGAITEDAAIQLSFMLSSNYTRLTTNMRNKLRGNK